MMRCPKCGTENTENRCLRCGEILAFDEAKEVPELEPSDQEIYVGPHYDKLLQKSTNVAAMVFGPYYFCYRKLFVLGFLLGIFEFTYFWYFAIELQLGYMGIFMMIVFPIFYYIFTNPLYLWLIQGKMAKIKKKYPENTKEYLEKKGGVTILYPILNFVLYIGIFLLIFGIYQMLK